MLSLQWNGEFTWRFTACRDYDHDTVAIISQAVSEVTKSTKPKMHPRFPNKQRAELKKFWSSGYRHWSDEQFKERLRIKQESFEYILASIRPMAFKQLTTMVSDPIEDHKQVGSWLFFWSIKGSAWCFAISSNWNLQLNNSCDGFMSLKWIFISSTARWRI